MLLTMPRTRDDVMRVARKLGRSRMAVRHRVLRFTKERILAHWTTREIAAVEEAARLNYVYGILRGDARLRDVAEKIGRSYPAVRHAARLIGARSQNAQVRRVDGRVCTVREYEADLTS